MTWHLGKILRVDTSELGFVGEEEFFSHSQVGDSPWSAHGWVLVSQTLPSQWQSFEGETEASFVISKIGRYSVAGIMEILISS